MSACHQGLQVFHPDRHWDEFYTKEDLGLLAEAGITHIRIPIGYWMFDVRRPREPFPPPPRDDNNGQRFYLRRLVKWADDLGLRVLLDLHAAPGSQNGFDNSGRMGTIGISNVFWIGLLPEL